MVALKTAERYQGKPVVFCADDKSCNSAFVMDKQKQDLDPDAQRVLDTLSGKDPDAR